MDKTLELIFITSEGGNTTLTVDSPIEPVDPAAVQAAMQTVIDENLFLSTSGALTGIKSARIVSRGVEAVDFAV
ncbi:hypothetical protein KP77_08060 [Jeotgalibacillus alimentarius]|uniref:DUF2922 domain-containing protein n=1 Tax=Jeotgalibacillus alimentarius TaxID=135826 RepID=A0A0C2SBF6_9BACL|nr:DUF2922 domain-containing protein [Jeotgalibacillus alimentarius]KIL51294.1 hypothetical protein KP77_08060 [Jeotgalibacillus alimentarius]